MSTLSLSIIFSVLYFSVFRIPAFIYLFKLNNGNTKVVFEIWLKLTMKKVVNTQAINLRQKAKHNMINLFNSFMKQVPITKKQSIDLLCKSMDWFLYDGDLRREKVEDDDPSMRKPAYWIAS